MNCIFFRCRKEPAAKDTMPICTEHLKGFGLKLGIIENEAFEQTPKGVGPFLIATREEDIPVLTFKVSGLHPNMHKRGLRLPTFRKNEVIIHCVSFTSLTGAHETCGDVVAISIEELEKMKAIPSPQTRQMDSVIRSQIDAVEFLKTKEADKPQASKPLLKLYKDHADSLMSNAFKNKDVPSTVFREDTTIPFTINWIFNIDKLMSKYEDFNDKNTIFYSIAYHLFPERLFVGEVSDPSTDLIIPPNCKFVPSVGLVAKGDLFPGTLLVLEGKTLTRKEVFCYLLAPDQSAVPTT